MSYARSTVSRRALYTMLFLLTHADVAFAAKNPSSKGKFPDHPDPNTTTSHIVRANFDDTFEASTRTIEYLGLFIEEADKTKGKINGNGKYQGICGVYGPCFITVTFVIYVETYSDDPKSRVSLDVIGHGFNGRGIFLSKRKGNSRQLRDQFFSDLQKILAISYR